MSSWTKRWGKRAGKRPGDLKIARNARAISKGKPAAKKVAKVATAPKKAASKSAK